MEELFASGLTGALVVWVFMGIVGLAIGASKNLPGLGALLGFLLGPIGWILLLLMNDPTAERAQVEAARQKTFTTRECPYCKEAMRRDASVCPHCQRDSEPWVFHDGHWWAKDPGGRWNYRDEANATWTAVE